jgi:hypothetical protein
MGWCTIFLVYFLMLYFVLQKNSITSSDWNYKIWYGSAAAFSISSRHDGRHSVFKFKRWILIIKKVKKKSQMLHNFVIRDRWNYAVTVSNLIASNALAGHHAEALLNYVPTRTKVNLTKSQLPTNCSSLHISNCIIVI